MYEALFAEDPKDLRARRAIALCSKNIASIQSAIHHQDEALAGYRKSLAIESELLAVDPMNAVYKRDISHSYGGIGEALFRLGQVAAGAESYEKAIAIRKELSDADPKNAGIREALARGHLNLGSQHAYYGDPHAALRSLERARLTALESILEFRPEGSDRRMQSDFGVAHERIAEETKARPDSKAARIACRAMRSPTTSRRPSRPGKAVPNWSNQVDASSGAIWRSSAVVPAAPSSFEHVGLRRGGRASSGPRRRDVLGKTSDHVGRTDRGPGGIGLITLFDASASARSRPRSGARRIDPALRRRLEDRRHHSRRQPRPRDSGLDLARENPERIGVVLGGGVSGLLDSENYFREVLAKGRDGARPTMALNHPPDQTTDRIAERWGILGPRSTITTACSSSATSLGYAADLIRHDLCDVVVTGGADTFARLTHGGFNALRPWTSSPAGLRQAAEGLTIGERREFWSSKTRPAPGSAAPRSVRVSSVTA
jgi:tetratricopeptide (TPR) repeat protein